ncbi:tyrosine-type recombinase/integrase [Acidobacteriota bacterium]
MARPKGTKKNGLKYLDNTQLKKFFDAVRQDEEFQYEVWFDLILYFGLRVCELTGLEMKDIKPDIRGIEITGRKNGLTKVYRKIDPVLWQKVEIWLQIRNARLCHGLSAYVFPSPIKRLAKTKSISEQAVKNAFKKYSRIAGLDKDFSVHALRHSCGVLKAKHGDHPIAIKEWLRQKSLNSTLVYLQEIEFQNQNIEASQIFGVYL